MLTTMLPHHHTAAAAKRMMAMATTTMKGPLFLRGGGGIAAAKLRPLATTAPLRKTAAAATATRIPFSQPQSTITGPGRLRWFSSSSSMHHDDDDGHGHDDDHEATKAKTNGSGSSSSNSNAALSDRRDASIARGVGMLTQVYAERALNAEVWDVEGRRFLDFASGIAVTNTGHRHPRVVEAVRDQLDKFTHTCHQVLPYGNYVSLAERLNELVPTTGNGGQGEAGAGAGAVVGNKTAFVTTGAEAVENAVKMARHATSRDAVISFCGGFHGRTYMGMSLTGKVKPYKQSGFGAMVPHVYHVPFPMDVHGVTVGDSVRAIQNLFASSVSPTQVAAVIIEPVQGEGGFYPAPLQLMQELRQLCDQHGILLIADEVQSGFARTGRLFAMDHYSDVAGVRPDLVTMAKGLGGGLPIAAVTGRSDVVDSSDPGGLGGTYAGNPLGIAAAHAVLDVIEEERLCERASDLGGKLTDRLEKLRQSSAPQIADVRGPGLMVAAEFCDPATGIPDAAFAGRVRDLALERGVVLLTCGLYGNVIRFLPPLTIPEEHFDEGLDVIESCIVQAAAACTE